MRTDVEARSNPQDSWHRGSFSKAIPNTGHETLMQRRSTLTRHLHSSSNKLFGDQFSLKAVLTGKHIALHSGQEVMKQGPKPSGGKLGNMKVTTTVKDHL
ncbi:hypothetical protein AV530_016594 [Patagioenas fasciata monilis]|uniref:Uncharacterized protein n=1 Tax=Patagioenas fasciata monilis TaxID=372326 RepID=A0A1V4J3G6_PATFA|nr:hypothetical protein AV530_016594 [Patagioenas fasciata monilis]